MINHTRSSNALIIMTIVILMLLITACAPATPQAGQEQPQNGASGRDEMLEEEPEVAATEAYADEPMEEEAEEVGPAVDAPESGAAGRSDDSATGTTGGGGEANNGEPGFPPPAATQAVEIMPPPVDDEQFADPLQAGEVDDNEDFSAYLQYRLDFQSFLGYPIQDLNVSERHIIRVTNRQTGLPVLGADVFVYDQQSLVAQLHTPATGIVYFFPLAYSNGGRANQYTVVVEKDQSSVEFILSEQFQGAIWDVEVDTPTTQRRVALDVMFLIDATGSMGDEIDELKNNILSISAQIAALPSQPDVRFGMVAYRDLGDQYVTQVYEFTPNVQDFQQSLIGIRAAGGGDDPESLNQALYESLNYVSWRGGETVSLVFLVADAPPHLDYSQDYPYSDSMIQASQMGIKIMPIASRLCQQRDNCVSERRAYQEQAEYIFRQLAQFTGGRYIFLAYDDTPTSSGEPGTESHVSEDQYTVQDLDALVVRLIMDELAALQGNQQ